MIPALSPDRPSCSPGWVWLTVLLFCHIVGCRPREIVCESQAFFQVPGAERYAGVAPFNIERIGAEVRHGDLEVKPLSLTFVEGNRARTDWMVRGHIPGQADVVYSPAEGVARGLHDQRQVFPMMRLTDSSSSRVRFGFRSSVCLDAGKGPCQRYGTEELFLVADMPCKQR